MNHEASGHGMWTLVALNSALSLMFAFSFFKPNTARDWRSFGVFSAFIVALFVEMCGFSLSLYLMSACGDGRSRNAKAARSRVRRLRRMPAALQSEARIVGKSTAPSVSFPIGAELHL